jgi:hypothetical protein
MNTKYGIRYICVLQDCSSEEEALESLHENVASLIKLLEVEGSKPVENRGEVT